MRDPIVPDSLAPRPCPECDAGKHRNCRGDTWDFILDEPVPCPCYIGNGEAHRAVQSALLEELHAADPDRLPRPPDA